MAATVAVHCPLFTVHCFEAQHMVTRNDKQTSSAAVDRVTGLPFPKHCRLNKSARETKRLFFATFLSSMFESSHVVLHCLAGRLGFAWADGTLADTFEQAWRR